MKTKRVVALITALLLCYTGLVAAETTTLGSGTKGNDPVAYWNFDESGGPTAYDKSGNSNNGTLNARTSGTNTAAGHMWYPQGKYGGAMDFDGTNDYVYIGLWNTTTALKATAGDWSYSW